MFPNIHAIGLLGLVIIPFVAIMCSPGWFPRRPKVILIWCVPFLVLGATSTLVLSVYGAPLTEWLVPGTCAVVAGCFVQKEVVFRATSSLLFVLSVSLCINAMALRSSGYTSAPDLTVGMRKAAEEATRRSLSEELKREYSPDDVLPAGPVSQLLPNRDSTTWVRKSPAPLWHTSISGLYEVRKQSGVFWYPGGAIEAGAERITWEPDMQPSI